MYITEDQILDLCKFQIAGRHQNRPNKLSPVLFQLVEDHIRSLKCHVSHYSLKSQEKCIFQRF